MISSPGRDRLSISAVNFERLMSNIVAVYNVRICDFIHLAFPSIDHINSIRIIVFLPWKKLLPELS